MFRADTTFVLSLIALAMGLKVILKAKKYRELGTGLCQFFGYIIAIAAIIVALFSGYRTVYCYFSNAPCMYGQMTHMQKVDGMQGPKMLYSKMKHPRRVK